MSGPAARCWRRGRPGLGLAGCFTEQRRNTALAARGGATPGGVGGPNFWRSTCRTPVRVLCGLDVGAPTHGRPALTIEHELTQPGLGGRLHIQHRLPQVSVGHSAHLAP